MGAVRIATADGQAVTVTSTTDTVSNWATRYLGSWWSAEPTTDLDGPTVSADLDEAELMALADVVEQGDAESAEYAGAELLVVRDGQLVTAVQEDRSLAYRWDEEWKLLRIVGTDETEIATAAARLARELPSSKTSRRRPQCDRFCGSAPWLRAQPSSKGPWPLRRRQ